MLILVFDNQSINQLINYHGCPGTIRAGAAAAAAAVAAAAAAAARFGLRQIHADNFL